MNESATITLGRRLLAARGLENVTDVEATAAASLPGRNP